MTLTRRRFMLESAQLAGGTLAAGLVRGLPEALAADSQSVHQLRTASPTLPPPPLRDKDYWLFADWLASYY
jgi:hypothetical protein